MGKEESGDEDRQGEGRAREIKQGRGGAEGKGGLGRRRDERGICTRSIFNGRRAVERRTNDTRAEERRGEKNKGDEDRLIEGRMVGGKKGRAEGLE